MLGRDSSPLESQEGVKRSLHLTRWLLPHTSRSHHSPSSCAANQSRGRKLPWPAVSHGALMAIYGKKRCQSLSGLQDSCWGHSSELQPQKLFEVRGCTKDRLPAHLWTSGGGWTPSSAGHILSESQPLAVIKNSPGAHCEVPSASTLCFIVNWGQAEHPSSLLPPVRLENTGSQGK